MIVHEHNEFLAAEPGHIRVPLFMGHIPPFENNIIIVAGLIPFHALQDVEETVSFTLAGTLTGRIDDTEELAETGLPEYPQIIP